MDASHSKFSEQITELKLEHQEGLAKSDRLTELLVQHFAGWNSQLYMIECGVAVYMTACWKVLPCVYLHAWWNSLKPVLFCFRNFGPCFWVFICLAWGCLPDLPMASTGHPNDENEEWLQELILYNREAHEWMCFFILATYLKPCWFFEAMHNKISSQHVGPMSGQNRPGCIYPSCCRWGMSANSQICWGNAFCLSGSSQPFPFQEWPHQLKDDDDWIGATP